MGQGFPSQRLGVNISAGTGLALTGTVVLSNSNNVSFGMQTTVGNSYVVTASAAAIGAISAGTTLASSGTISFSDANGLSFGLDGNTLTASVNAAPRVTGADWDNLSYVDGFVNVTTLASITDTPFFVPFFLPYDVTLHKFVWEGSRIATNQDNLFSLDIGIYTLINQTQASLLGSVSVSYSGTSRAAQSGIRRFAVDGIPSAITSLSIGQYVLGVLFDATATSGVNYALRGASTGSYLGFILPGADSTVTATSALTATGVQFFGRYTTTSGSLPGSFADSQVIHGPSGSQDRIPMWFRIGRTD